MKDDHLQDTLGDSCVNDEAPTASAEQDSFKEKYFLLLAEGENMRRRLQRESQDSVRFATQRIILDLLEPYDNLEKALFHAGYSPSDEVRNWAIGFKMIYQQFKDWLSAQGVHAYACKGERFNAALHEAVETLVSRDVAEGTILEELSKGYKLHDRVIRPAKVVIAVKPPQDPEVIEQAEAPLEEPSE